MGAALHKRKVPRRSDRRLRGTHARVQDGHVDHFHCHPHHGHTPFVRFLMLAGASLLLCLGVLYIFGGF